ncbi:MAG: flagellar M-ring protein FliF [Desulfobacteraceae bacterium]|nr:flagellar M-ring protein FliF [Desulfobacteraceae bacterium]
MDAVREYLRRLRQFAETLSLQQKISYAGGLVVLLAALAFLLYLNNRTDYSPLYAGLSQSDMGEISQALKAKKIPYRATDGSIEVPKEQLYETRLTLASEGIPKGSGSGFEIFDQQKLGSTEFVQKINYQRALQGELARTINGMSEIQESRVHLVLPEESLFKEDRKPPSAAVVVKLRSGAKMEQKQLQGIAHLVAATVRGLEEDRITIMSTDGKVLYKKNAQDQAANLSNTQIERKQRMEDDMRQKIQTMLEQVLGPNKVLARVALDLDQNQVQIAEETYNPDSAVVRSQQRTTETSEGKEAGAKGNPDTPINLEGKLLQSAPQGGGEGAKGGKQFNRQREIVNYEINKTSKQIVQMPGNIKKISVAVIVDGRYENKAGNDGKQKPAYVARAADEMKSIEELVKKSVGYNESRGDQITVSNIPFAPEFGSEMMQGENQWIAMFKSYQKVLLNIGLGALVLIFVVRPFLKRFRKMADEVEKQLPPPATAETVEDQIKSLLFEPNNKLSIRKQSTALVQYNPDKATEIIRQWLRDEV